MEQGKLWHVLPDGSGAFTIPIRKDGAFEYHAVFLRYRDRNYAIGEVTKDGEAKWKLEKLLELRPELDGKVQPLLKELEEMIVVLDILDF